MWTMNELWIRHSSSSITFKLRWFYCSTFAHHIWTLNGLWIRHSSRIITSNGGDINLSPFLIKCELWMAYESVSPGASSHLDWGDLNIPSFHITSDLWMGMNLPLQQHHHIQTKWQFSSFSSAHTFIPGIKVSHPSNPNRFAAVHFWDKKFSKLVPHMSRSRNSARWVGVYSITCTVLRGRQRRIHSAFRNYTQRNFYQSQSPFDLYPMLSLTSLICAHSPTTK